MTQLKLALYGTNGHQVARLVPRLERVSVVAVAGVAEETFEAWRGEMPQAFERASRYKTLPALLERADAQLISICSPRRDQQHDDIVAALRAGLHVYAEKPLATSLEGLEAIAQAADEAGKEVRSMTGMPYDPVFRAIKKQVDEGSLGTVVQVFAQKSYPYHDRRPQDPGVDGGLIPQAGIHAVSVVRYVTGMEFEEVFATATGRGNPGEGALDMAAHVAARLTGGALCTIACNYCNPPGIGYWGNDQLRLHGTGGMVEAVDGLTRTQVALGDQAPAPLETPTDGTAGYPGLFADYVAHLLDGTPMLLTQEDSLANTRVVLRAQESARRGEPLRV